MESHFRALPPEQNIAKLMGIVKNPDNIIKRLKGQSPRFMHYFALVGTDRLCPLYNNGNDSS